MNASLRTNHRILVVDDNRAIHEDFRKILSDTNPLQAAEARLFGKPEAVRFQIDFAQQGEEGFELVNKSIAEGNPFAMAFVDVRMPPGWDGVETTRNIWKIDPDLQIVICTAYSDYSWSDLSDVLGQPDRLLILKKPFDSIEVVQLAHALTDKWRLLQASKRTVAELEQAVTQRTVELDVSNGKLQAVLDAATQVSIIATDTKGLITVFNSGAERMLGYRAEEIVGKESPALIHVDAEVIEHGRELTKQFGRSISGFDVFLEFARQGKPEEREWTYVRKDGSHLTVALVVTALRDATGVLTGFLGVAKDITVRKRAEQELLRAKEAAEAATRARSNFLANMSHEIRTPMNGILGMTTLLLDSELSAEQHRYADAIAKSGESLLSIINDILDFSKIEAGKLTFETLNFDLHEAVESCVELFAQRAQGKGLELACLVESEVPAWLRGDPGRLRQVLTNLIGNALKFTDCGEVIVKVSLEKETNSDALLRFEVKDTGIGVPPEIQSRLFQAFTQAEASTNRKYGGTGLGLAISRQLVEIMHGQIGIESAPGSGSTFWFTARLARQADRGHDCDRNSGDLLNLHVLIVDDNETNREILQHQTRAWKMRNGSAGNSSDALEELHRAYAAGDPYQIVLLDLYMPGTDGLALAKSIRAEKKFDDLRLVLLSSSDCRLSSEELKAAGIYNSLMKPIRQSLLFDCLATLMGRANLRRLNANQVHEPVVVGRRCRDAPAALQRSATEFIESVSDKGIDMAKKISPLLPSEAPAKKKLRILLAEDNMVNQEVAQGLLRKLGYRADAVANGAEALQTLQQIPYDVILMDCQMPELDGYETTRRIRQFEQHRVAPFDWKAPLYIIAMTANAMEGDREKCLIAGMNDYVGKPVRLEDLRGALSRLPEVHISGGSSIAQEKQPVTAQRSPVPLDEPLVDLNRLRDINDDDPERIRDLVSLYLTQATGLIENLRTAIDNDAVESVAKVAHNLVGSSISCGVKALTQPLRELERLSHADDLSEAGPLFNQVEQTFPKVRTHLNQFVKKL